MFQTMEPLIYSEFGHDEDLAELITLFVNELPQRMQALGDAAASLNYAEGGRLAHQLKGAFGSYGFHPLTQSLQQLETAFQELADAGQIEALLRIVTEKVSRVRKGSRI